MGQQQLLLLVLATVIVGLATVAGIQAFDQGQTRANLDANTQTAVKIASDAQAKIKEPSQFGGYDNDLSKAAGSMTLDELGYRTNGGESNDAYETTDGSCTMNNSNSNSNIEITCDSDQSEAVVVVKGTDAKDIETTTQKIKS
jgi:hypothetical protein